MGHESVLKTFKIECEACLSVKGEDKPKAPKEPKINDRGNDSKIIRWATIFKEFILSSCGSRAL